MQGLHAFPAGLEPWSNICPLYVLSANHTAQQETAAIAAAEYECTGEIDPKQKSLYEQINQYRHDHGIKEPASPESVPVPPGSISVPFHRTAGGEISYEVLAKEAGSIGETLGPKACAARVRKSYPRTYDDMDDATLTKKVLAKYPGYCDVSTSPPDFIPDIKGIR